MEPSEAEGGAVGVGNAEERVNLESSHQYLPHFQPEPEERSESTRLHTYI